MFAIPGTRVFRLSSSDRGHGVSCDEQGVFVGSVPLMRCMWRIDGVEVWEPRPDGPLNNELSVCYGLPIDVMAKSGGLSTIARALNQGNLALAKIAAVQLQFPDPPQLTKGALSLDDVTELAAELYWSGLLKGDWNPDQHPRTGTKPNPGRFAEVPKEPKLPTKPGWPVKAVNTEVREAVKKIAAKIAARAELLGLGALGDVAFIAAEIDDAIKVIRWAFRVDELNQSEDRLVAQMKANFDPPKTFEELQKPPTENILGYEQHHIVEQTDDNIKKDIQTETVYVEKFGQEKIDDPSNIVWVPRLKHEIISGYYSSKPGGPGTSTVRDTLSESEFDAQRAAGLDALRQFGVLK